MIATAAAGFGHVTTARIVGREPIEAEDEFTPSRWFPDHAAYVTYRTEGALLLDAVAD